MNIDRTDKALALAGALILLTILADVAIQATRCTECQRGYWIGESELRQLERGEPVTLGEWDGAKMQLTGNVEVWVPSEDDPESV